MAQKAPRVALITGAGSGIGYALAAALAKQRAMIAGIDVNEAGLRKLSDEIASGGGRCATSVTDVTDAPALHQEVAKLERELGPTDLLIASAGIGRETGALKYSAPDVAQIINVNLIGVSNSIAAVLPGMIERKRGHLVGLSSVASFHGLPRLLAYCASKSGVNALLEGIRVEVAPHNIAVSTICPGWIKTPMTEPIKLPPNEVLPVEKAVDEILWAIRKRKKFHAFPGWIVRRLRFLRWLPLAWQDALVAKMVRKL